MDRVLIGESLPIVFSIPDKRIPPSSRRKVKELEKIRRELDEMTKTMLSMEKDRDMRNILFEDCNKKKGEEIESLR